jgi:hypothetical protein
VEQNISASFELPTGRHGQLTRLSDGDIPFVNEIAAAFSIAADPAAWIVCMIFDVGIVAVAVTNSTGYTFGIRVHRRTIAPDLAHHYIVPEQISPAPAPGTIFPPNPDWDPQRVLKAVEDLLDRRVLPAATGAR